MVAEVVVQATVDEAVIEVVRAFNDKIIELEHEVERLNRVIARLDDELAEWHSRYIDGSAGLTVGAKGPRPSTEPAPEPDATASGAESRVGG
jgi:hypothetical protein